jgi:hypothetical protein
MNVAATSENGNSIDNHLPIVSDDAARQERFGEIDLDDPATWPEIGKWPKEPTDVPDCD